jgi:Branched-chain amino acid transport system / permease component
MWARATGSVCCGSSCSAAIAVAAWWLLSQTVFGRRLFAVGSNARATQLLGVDVRRVQLLAFVASDVSAGIGGVLLLTRHGGATSDSGAADWSPRPSGTRCRRTLRTPSSSAPVARRSKGVMLGYLVEGDLSVTQVERTVRLSPGDFVVGTAAQRYRITAPGHHE